MSSEGKPRFRSNWLTWTVDRQDRNFRVYVVEPRAYSPKDHASIFWAALDHFLPQLPADFALGSSHAVRGYAPAYTEPFDLLTFPEAFLDSNTLLECLQFIDASGIANSCVHVGLRPPDKDKATHLFKATDLVELIQRLRAIDALHAPDLDAFADWLMEQRPADRFNVGCVFMVDPEYRIRICLHPKLVRSKFEVSVFRDRHMKEADLISLITLEPEDKQLSPITIQPLICSDALKLPTDRPENHPIEAVTRHRSCFQQVKSDHVDIVSIAACTPNVATDDATNEQSKPLYLAWHQLFRESFVRAASDDDCRRHHMAAFVLSNYRNVAEYPKQIWGGLSGTFIPLPVTKGTYSDTRFIAQTQCVYAHFPDEASEHERPDKNRWEDGDIHATIQAEAEKLGHAKPIDLGHIIALSPLASIADPMATLFGFTMMHLPREANRWRKNPHVSDFRLNCTTASRDSGEPRLVFKPETL